MVEEEVEVRKVYKLLGKILGIRVRRGHEAAK